MLQITRADDLVNPDSPEGMPPEFRLPIESLTEVVAFIRRRLSTILLTCLITLGIGILYLISAVPTFTASAELIVDSKAAPGDAVSVSTIVDSQIAVLKSENIARAVVQRLGLAEDPEFAQKDSVVRGAIRSTSRLLGWSRPEGESGAIHRAMESFERKFSVERAGVTYIIKISFESIDPERAAQILNTVAETYVAAELNAKYASSLRGEEWVKDRLNELRSRASAAQKALADYKNRKDIAESAGTDNSSTPASQSTPRTQTELRELEDAAQSAAATYDNFLRVLRYMDAQQQSLPVLEAHVLSRALPPMRASSPKLRIVLGISSIGGVLLGIAIAMLRDRSDRGVRTCEQVCKELQMPCIAVVPTVKSLGGKLGALIAHGTRRQQPAPPSSDGSSRNIGRTDSPIWIVTDAKRSRFTDAFLEIKLALDSTDRNGKRSKVIGITSTYPEEGKSTVAAALALLMAHSGARVILLDCDLQKHSLSAELAPGAECDLLDVMSGAASLRETTWIEPTTQLALLPLSNNKRIYPSEVLVSGALDKLFQTLREPYDYVIVDLPAVAPFAGAQARACALDSLIFVIEASRTNIDAVKRGLDVTRHENVVGIVLNKAKFSVV
ncbi:AAA family ATPase [Bradyrhizobium sp. ARR65]|uniref:AAA family ATPase n=1 Tax=Bradyrhizobium sp. ARR65 TaxID=1040989 RepID=UPI0006877897|nr:AAA family ATPase [Bradyrhizobium sp. ARR65]